MGQHHILQRGRQRDAAVRRERPGRGSPDCEFNGLAALATENIRGRIAINEGERHINRGGLLVAVFDLSLSQRRTAVQTPMHGLETAVQVPTIDDFRKRADNVRLKGKVHRQIRVGPIAQYTHSHKIGFLRLYLLARVITAVLPKLSGGDFMTGLTDLLFDIELDGQPMAVPAGHVG